MERITAAIRVVDEEASRFRLIKLKEQYAKGAITEATYYQNQCEIFENLHRKGKTAGDVVPHVRENLPITHSTLEQTRSLLRKAYSHDR